MIAHNFIQAILSFTENLLENVLLIFSKRFLLANPRFTELLEKLVTQYCFEINTHTLLYPDYRIVFITPHPHSLCLI